MCEVDIAMISISQLHYIWDEDTGVVRLMDTVMIENGKTPDEPYNASLGFWLPPDSPYGNFSLKFMKNIQRLDEANRRIASSFHFWSECSRNRGGILPSGALERHVFSTEEAVYMMRRAADELVSLIWCLSKQEKDQQYPKKIEVDCLGAVVNQDEKERLDLFSPHIDLMEVLNNISNAFKHSFIDSDHTLIGLGEPRVHALKLDRNRLNSRPTFYDVSLPDLVTDYNEFYKDCVSWLRTYSEKYRQGGSCYEFRGHGT